EGYPPGLVEISVDREAKARVEWIQVHRVHQLGRVDVTAIGPLRVTSPTRTIVDLASDASVEILDRAIDDALRRGLTSMPRLRWAVRRLCGPGRAGTRKLRRALQEREPGYVPSASG